MGEVVCIFGKHITNFHLGVHKGEVVQVRRLGYHYMVHWLSWKNGW